MATLADNDIKETPRVVGLIVLTIAVVSGTSIALDFLGLWWVWQFIYGLPFWTGLAASLALWGGVMLLCLHGPRVLRELARLLGRRGPAAVIAIARTGGFALAAVAMALCAVWAVACSRLTPLIAAIAVMLEPCRMGLMLIAEPLLVTLAPAFKPLGRLWRGAMAVAAVLEPLRGVWRNRVSPLLGRAELLRQQIQFEWTLWRAYRSEFRGIYANYWEFKSEFNARLNAGTSGPERDEPPAPAPAPDPFAAACKVMGLPTDGNFTEAELKARYRALMKEVHPDIAGPNERATQVNAANMLIKERKGW